jgi:signal transduction histidine kinase
MIEQILDFTRARIGGGIPIQPAPVDLQSLAGQLVEEFEGAAPQQIHLESVGDTRGEWDDDRLAQVISNLLGNAVDHGDPNQPVRLKLDGSEPDVVRISVWNAGAVPEDLLSSMFDPFRGATVKGTAQRSKGLGLGLYIVQQIVQVHGGNIEVRSSASEGTTFLVSIPRKALPRS